MGSLRQFNGHVMAINCSVATSEPITAEGNLVGRWRLSVHLGSRPDNRTELLRMATIRRVRHPTP